MYEGTHITRQELSLKLRHLDLWSKPTDDAFDLAEQVHATQRRAGGGPYLEEHVYPVTASVAAYLAAKHSDQATETVLIALLHDTVEDSATVDVETVQRRFGTPVADGVRVLTKPEKRPGSSAENSEAAEERYVSAVSAADWNVRVVKVHDRLNNLAAVHERSRDRRRTYLDETRMYYLDLARSVDPELAEKMDTILDEQERRFERTGRDATD